MQHLTCSPMPEELCKPPRFLVEIDDRYPSAGTEVLADVLKVGHTVLQVVIGDTVKDQIDASLRQQGIIRLGKDHFDVCITFFSSTCRDIGIHICVDIDGVHLATWPDSLGQ